MLEKIMNLHTGMVGSAGDAGHTSYLSKTDQKEYRDADESQRKMAEPLENERQAVKPHEPAGVVSVAVLHGSSWTGLFSERQGHRVGRTSSGIPLCGSNRSDCAAFAQTGIGFYI